MPLPMSLSPAPSPAMSTSIPLAGYSFGWYDDANRTSDEDLLEQFFQENPRLATQVLHMKTHKGKRQTDAELIRYYQFGLKIYGLLKERKWGVRLYTLSIRYVVQDPVGRMAVTWVATQSSSTLG